MSISKQQIIHIASEVVIITGISIYFQLKISNLHNCIERLENKIEQQDQIIQNHDQLLLRIMNNVDVMNTNIVEMRKSLDSKNNQQQPVKAAIKKDNKVKEISNKKTDMKLPKAVHQLHNVIHNPSHNPLFAPNIPMKENIFVMEIKPNENFTTSSTIEEIFDEEDLDKELEKELKELDKEIIVDEENSKDDDTDIDDSLNDTDTDNDNAEIEDVDE